MGSLDITLKKASKLPNIEKFGKSDPYVSLTFKDCKEKSKVIDDNLDPVWNQNFQFRLSAAVVSADRLELKVLDKEVIGADRLLGTAEIDGRQISKSLSVTDYAITLTSPKGDKLEATLELSLKYTPPATQPGGGGTVGGEAGGAGGGYEDSTAGEMGATVKLRKRNINYSQKEQDFQVRIKVVEARQIHGANIDPLCKVTFCDIPKQTRIIKSSNSPQWNQIFYYNVHMSAAKLVDELISFTVFNSQMLRHDALIGSFKFDCGLAYESDNHALINRWLLLSDPEDPMAGAKGYLKVSVLILGPGDEAVSMKGKPGEEEDIEANLLRPAGVTLRPACYDIKIYSAEELPRMDAGILNKLKTPFSKNVSTEYVDPYVLVNFAGKDLKTKILEGTDHPSWNECLKMGVLFPSMCDKLRLTVFDWDRSTANDPIGTFWLKLSDFYQDRDDEYGFLPTFGPCFVNLYGSPREYSDLPDAFEALNLGKAPGVAYRGRLLMELTTRFVDEVTPDKSEPVSSDDQQRIQKFLRKRHYILHATFMSANMISKCDGAVQFEISVGNYGNILEDRIIPASSTTQPTNTVFDGKHYFFLPWGGDKPTCSVEAYFEDISVRLYTLNFFMKLKSDLKEMIDYVKLALELKFTGPEHEAELLSFVDILIVRLSENLPHWDDYPGSNPMNDLDKKMYMVRKVTLTQVKDDLLKVKKSGKSMQDYLSEMERTLSRIQSISVEPQNSMPDVVIWMLDGKKRIAYARIPANELIYAQNERFRGSLCGSVQTICLSKMYVNADQQKDNWEIPAQLRVQLWFGLEKDETSWHQIPTEGKLHIAAETYENETKLGGWRKGGVDVYEWSDHTGKLKLPKDVFKLPPEDWDWDGDWYVAPELSLSFRVDTGYTEYTQDVFYLESRTPISATWVKAEQAYTDMTGNPSKPLTEIKCPDGWAWDGDWQVDLNRPCDEDGWEYAIGAEMQGWVAVQKVFHCARRKRYMRKRKLIESSEGKLDVVSSSLLSRKQKERMQLLEKLKPDEGWEFALSHGGKYHEKERKLDCARRRRWHRRMKPKRAGVDSCVVLSIGDGDKSKTSTRAVENMIVPRMFTKYAEPHSWHLRAYIYQARDLPAADSTGLSDPYCRVVFEYMSDVTITLEQTLCPTWDQTLIFPNIEMYGDVSKIVENPPPVTLELFDYNKIQADCYLGRCQLKPVVITGADRPKINLDWHQLTRHKRPAGEILAAFELILTETSELPLPPPRGKESTYIVPHGIRPKMQLTRIEILCWGVRNMRKFQLSSVNNPSVEFDIGERFVESDVLKSAKFDSNFVNKRLTMDVMLPVEARYMPPLNIRVIDHRLFGRKPTVGICSLSELAKFRCQPLAADLDPLIDFPILRTEDPALLAGSCDVTSNAPSIETFAGDSVLLHEGGMNGQPEGSFVLPVDSDSEKAIEKSRSKAKILDLSQLDEDIDWWSKYYMSLGEDDKCAKYKQLGYDMLTHYKISLESVAPFNGFQDLCTTFTLTRGKNTDEEDENIAGEFKGTFFVYPIPEDPSLPKPMSYLDQLVPDLKKLDCVVNVYIVRASDLQPSDPSGLADPYVVIKCGSNKQDSCKEYIPNNLNPEFGKMFQFKAAIPRDKDLTIKVLDYDLLSSDDVIGETVIDLEDRILSKYRATCGLPQSYCISGPCQWRDQQTPTEILCAFCKRNRIPEPYYDENNTTYKSDICRVGQRTFVLSKLEKGIPANPHFGPSKERLALYVLNSLTLVKEHVECRTLYSSLQPDLSQGKLEMWVDIFPVDLGPPGPPFDISCRKPKEYELRVIIWNTTEVILEETSITGEKMSDIYVKSWISGIDERQATDVHYRSLDGDGNFNWRFVFPFSYIPAENFVVVKRKENFFSLDETEIRLHPQLIVQVWDNDKFSADDFLGTLELNLSDLIVPAKNAKKCQVEMVDPKNPKRKTMNLFECKRAYGYWPFINDETGEALLTGKVEMELELIPKFDADLRPAGRGRDEPNDNPHLDPPKRPETSFFWFTSPWKTFKFIVWKRFKKIFIITLVVILLGLLVCLFVYSIPGLIAKKMIGA